MNSNSIQLTENNLKNYIEKLEIQINDLKLDLNNLINDRESEKNQETHEELIEALKLAIQNTEALAENLEDIRIKWSYGILLTPDEWDLLDGIGFKVESKENSNKINISPQTNNLYNSNDSSIINEPIIPLKDSKDSAISSTQVLHKKNIALPPPEEIDRLLNISINSDISLEGNQNNENQILNSRDRKRVYEVDDSSREKIDLNEQVEDDSNNDYSNLNTESELYISNKNSENLYNGKKSSEEILQYQQIILKLESDIQQHEEKYNNLINELKLKEEDLKNEKIKNSNFDREISNLKKELETKSTIDPSLTSLLDDMKKEAELLQNQFQESFSFERNRLLESLNQSKLEILQLKQSESIKEKEISSLRDIIIQKESAINELQSKINTLETDSRNDKEKIASLEDEIKTFKKEKNSVSSTEEALKKKVYFLEEKIKKMADEQSFNIQKYITETGIDIFETVIKGETQILRNNLDEMRTEMEKKSSSVNNDMQKLKKMIDSLASEAQDPVNDISERYDTAQQQLLSLETFYNSKPEYKPHINDPIDKAVSSVLNSINTGNVRIDIKRVGKGEYMIDRPVRVRIVKDHPVIRIGNSYIPLRSYLTQLYSSYIVDTDQENAESVPSFRNQESELESHQDTQANIQSPLKNTSQPKKLIKTRSPSVPLPRTSSPLPVAIPQAKHLKVRSKTPAPRNVPLNVKLVQKNIAQSTKKNINENTNNPSYQSPKRTQSQLKNQQLPNRRNSSPQQKSNLLKVPIKGIDPSVMDDSQVKMLKKLALKQQIEQMRQKKLAN